MKDNQEIVILYTKYPLPGHCKTRLIPKLGLLGAARLQRQMSGEIAAILERIKNDRPIRIVIHFDGGTQWLMEQWLGDNYQYQPQIEGDLGTRMEGSISDQLGSFSRIVLLGSDCPGINELIVCEALDALCKNYLVIDPTFESCYYLIGFRKTIQPGQLHTIFQDMEWSTDLVFTNTIKKIKQLNLRYHTLPQLHDIDTPDDLRYIGNYSDAQ